MPHSVRAPKLETRTSRLKLPVAGKPVFVRVAPGISLGYRRNAVAGTWVLRVADGQGGAWTKRIGIADDVSEGDGVDVLTFWPAQARAKSTGQGNPSTIARAPLTVDQAARTYLVSLEARNPRTANDARLRLQRLFLPIFGTRRVEELTRGQLETWRDSLVYSGSDTVRQRRSRDTANRVLTIVKAFLNHAVGDPSNGIERDAAWRLVRPFQRVASAREIHFDASQVRKLMGASADPFFRDLNRPGIAGGWFV